MKKIVLFIVVCFICGSLWSQMKLSYRSYNYAGLLEGEKGSSFALSTTHGVYAKRFFVGLGAGLDYYGTRTIPVFLGVTHFAGKKENILLTLNGGMGYVWDKSNPATSTWSSIGNDYKNKPFYDAAIGYKIASKKGYQGFILSAGYSLKKMQFREYYNVPCLTPPCPVGTDYYDYVYRRLMLRLGYAF